MELDAARWTFQHLGADPDSASTDQLYRKRTHGAVGGLTTREVQILRLVATA